LFVVAKLTNLRWLKHRETVYRIGAILMIAVGIYFVWKGLTF